MSEQTPSEQAEHAAAFGLAARNMERFAIALLTQRPPNMDALDVASILTSATTKTLVAALGVERTVAYLRSLANGLERLASAPAERPN